MTVIKHCGRSVDHPAHAWILGRMKRDCPGGSITVVTRTARPTWDETWMAVAKQIAQRSLCSRDQVGAVVVSAANRIIDTGYNGPPAGHHATVGGVFDGKNWVTRTCQHWCNRAKYAAELGVSDDYHDCPSLHAEANALMFSDRRLREGGTIYVTSGTCSGCAKLVANSGLARAVYAPTSRPDGASHRDSDRWYDFLKDCGLEVVLC
jgi:dCMP deaminase